MWIAPSSEQRLTSDREKERAVLCDEKLTVMSATYFESLSMLSQAMHFGELVGFASFWIQPKDMLRAIQNDLFTICSWCLFGRNVLLLLFFYLLLFQLSCHIVRIFASPNILSIHSTPFSICWPYQQFRSSGISVYWHFLPSFSSALHLRDYNSTDIRSVVSLVFNNIRPAQIAILPSRYGVEILKYL